MRYDNESSRVDLSVYWPFFFCALHINTYYCVECLLFIRAIRLQCWWFTRAHFSHFMQHYSWYIKCKSQSNCSSSYRDHIVKYVFYMCHSRIEKDVKEVDKDKDKNGIVNLFSWTIHSTTSRTRDSCLCKGIDWIKTDLLMPQNKKYAWFG